MKKAIQIFLILFIALFAGCSKDSAQPSEPSKLELNIKDLASYINQDYKTVRKKLDKFTILDSIETGKRNFTILLIDENNIVFEGVIRETDNKVFSITITYNGFEGGPSIGDPYESELWYFYINKVRSLYGKSQLRVYEDVNLIFGITEEELFKMIEENGKHGKHYSISWDVIDAKRLNVVHTDKGDFQLTIWHVNNRSSQSQGINMKPK